MGFTYALTLHVWAGYDFERQWRALPLGIWTLKWLNLKRAYALQFAHYNFARARYTLAFRSLSSVN